jgi:hypothetical protein
MIITRTATNTEIAQARALRLKDEAFKLRALRHEYARMIAHHALIVARASKQLIRLHKEMDAKARAMVGPDFRECHEVSFEEFPSMAQQRAENYGEHVAGPGLVDIYTVACEMARFAGLNAAAAEPPQLPSE